MNRIAVALLSAAALLTGCADDANIQMMTRDLPIDDRDAVLSAAQKVLIEHFPRMTVDRQSYLITTAPVEYNTTDESGTSRDLVKAPTTMRHLARLGVAKSGDRTIARIRVDIERRDTSRRDVVSPEPYRLSDSPSYSPIERDAARSREQNSTWTKVKRDSKLERSILEELERQFAGDAPNPRPAPDGAERAPAAEAAAGGDASK